MATFKVTAPAGDYQGKVGNVQFTDGCAEIDDERNPMELDYCRNAGYLVEEVDDDTDEDTGVGTEAEGEEGGEAEREAPVVPATFAAPVVPAALTGQARTPAPGSFDPAQHNADEVLAHLDTADEAEARRVLDAEAEGKNRKGITGQRDQILDSKKEEQ